MPWKYRGGEWRFVVRVKGPDGATRLQDYGGDALAEVRAYRDWRHADLPRRRRRPATPTVVLLATLQLERMLERVAVSMGVPPEVAAARPAGPGSSRAQVP